MQRPPVSEEGGASLPRPEASRLAADLGLAIPQIQSYVKTGL
jgi:hypothetical protein